MSGGGNILSTIADPLDVFGGRKAKKKAEAQQEQITELAQKQQASEQEATSEVKEIPKVEQDVQKVGPIVEQDVQKVGPVVRAGVGRRRRQSLFSNKQGRSLLG